MDTVGSHQLDLYELTLADRSLRRLTDWGGSDETSPVASPNGDRVLFISDRSGINNIYELDLAGGVIRPITNSLSGVYQLSLSRDGGRLAFASLNRSGFDIFLMQNPFLRSLKVQELELTSFFKQATGASRDTVALAVQAPAASVDSTQLYGDSIMVDFSNYVFAEAAEEVPKDSSMSRLPALTDNVDEDGNYRVNKYKLNFTPDIIYGNAGYDTFYGVTGSTVMAFSDILGDHQIILSTNLLLDLKNSDYGIQYYYLPNKIDLGFGAFHSARFLIVQDAFGGSLYRFRVYGASLSALLPIDRFSRFEFGGAWYNLMRENLDVINAPVQEQTVIVPNLSYVYDTILWGFTAPVTGTRYRLDLYGTPQMGAEGPGFVNVGGDYRTYFRLGKSYSLAVRLSGGASFGTTPTKFIIGGVANWINPRFEGGYIPITEAQDFIFLTTGVPLRGYNYNAGLGSRYALFNLELRYPLFAFLQAGPLPLGLQSFGGAIFFDAGTAWSRVGNKELVKLFRRLPNGAVTTDDLLLGTGTGARVLFLFFLLRFDVAWAYTVSGWSPPRYYFSLGADF